MKDLTKKVGIHGKIHLHLQWILCFCRRISWHTEFPLYLEQSKKQMAQFLFGSPYFFLTPENLDKFVYVHFQTNFVFGSNHKMQFQPLSQWSWILYFFFYNSVVEAPVIELLIVTSTFVLCVFFFFKSPYGIPINIEFKDTKFVKIKKRARHGFVLTLSVLWMLVDVIFEVQYFISVKLHIALYLVIMVCRSILTLIF